MYWCFEEMSQVQYNSNCGIWTVHYHSNTCRIIVKMHSSFVFSQGNFSKTISTTSTIKVNRGHARTVHQKYVVWIFVKSLYHINYQMKNVDYLNCKVYTVLFFHCIMSFSLIYMTSIKNIQYNFADKVTKKWFHHPCLMLHLMLKSWNLKYFNITQCKCLTVTTFFLFGKTLNY